MTVATVACHVNYLVKAGLVELERVELGRGSGEHFYVLAAERDR